MAEDTLIMTLAISIMLNVVIISIWFITGVAREQWRRFFNKMKYKSGKYTNFLFVSKSGVMKEAFRKHEDNGFVKIMDASYGRNPKTLYHYKGIPTYLYAEGRSDPLDIFSEAYLDLASPQEIDKSLVNTTNFDLVAWIQKNAIWFLLGGVVLIIMFGVGVYFNWQIFDTIVQQKARIIVENATGVIPR